MKALRLLLIGQAASGKTTLSRALAQQLDLPCYRIDDFRRWLGDGSIGSDYQARAAFLHACSNVERGIFEFSAVGHHRDAVRQAMKERLTPLNTIYIACPEETRQARLKERQYNTPYPDWGVGPNHASARQLDILDKDFVNNFWTDKSGWTQLKVRGDEPVDIALGSIFNHLKVSQPEPQPGVTPSVASKAWIAKRLQLPLSAIAQNELPDQANTQRNWRLTTPEVDEESLEDLIKTLHLSGWHTLQIPTEKNYTQLMTMSPDLQTKVELQICQRTKPSAASYAASFIYQLERASAFRSLNNVSDWFLGASTALQSLEQYRTQAQYNNTTENLSGYTPHSAPPLPQRLKMLRRRCALSFDLALTTRDADHIYEYASAVMSDIHLKPPATAAELMLDSWWPAIRKIFDARDALWNFCDVAAGTNGYLRSGILFRGSSPTRYHHDPRYSGSRFFERWCRATNINQCFDLRTKQEITDSPYPPEWQSLLTVNHHPTEAHPLQMQGENSPALWREYLAFFDTQQTLFRTIVNNIAAQDHIVLVHCYSGIYRTGVVIAVLCYLCDVPQHIIKQNYLTKGDSAQLECIEAILKRLTLIGNANALARHLGIDAATLATFREKLIQ